MALIAEYTDPFTGDVIADAYFWAAGTYFDHTAKHARIVYFVHPSKAAAYAGKPPIGQVELNVGASYPEGVTLPTFDEMIAANAAAYGALAVAVDDLAIGQADQFPNAVRDNS